jgi:CO/xanthine dehydrogenase FAD-binding subunit
MIVEYARPKTFEAALQLLMRTEPVTVAIGGGSTVSKHYGKKIAVVDLQDLGLNYVQREGNVLRIGATVTLARLEAEFAGTDLVEAIQIQAGRNQRNTATIAGLLKKANGRSPLLTALLALDASLVWLPGDKTIRLEEWLSVRTGWNGAALIKEVVIPQAELAIESIARSPKDTPIICLATAKFADGKIRSAVGGFGEVPLVFAGEDVAHGMEDLLTNSTDEWASAEYRLQAAKVLANRISSRLLLK